MLKQIASNVYEGTLDECRKCIRRMGYHYGEFRGRTISFEGTDAVYAPADENNFSVVELKSEYESYVGILVKSVGKYIIVFTNPQRHSQLD